MKRLAMGTLLRTLALGTALLLGATVHAAAPAEEDDDVPTDPASMGKTPAELWKQVDDLYLDKQWKQVCSRLDRLRELGEDLKKKKQKAGYAYVRCAAQHLKSNNLNATDASLELARQVAGDTPERKPVEAELHRALARLAVDKEDLPQALAHFEIAEARNPEPRKAQEASLLLTKFARTAYDKGFDREAKEALSAALVYYPENRDALQLQSSLTFWSRATWWLVGAGLVMAALIFFLQLRKSTHTSGGDPYDPYAS
jgi:tetratricopeptide (TPR) repeat protein